LGKALAAGKGIGQEPAPKEAERIVTADQKSHGRMSHGEMHFDFGEITGKG
jgi:hypothetical protein